MQELDLDERLHAQINHPLYKDARNEYTRVQREQMMKAAQKYPTPLNPSEWGGEKLVRHAMEELVDQSHYLIGIKEEFRRLNKENEELKIENKRLRELMDEVYEQRNKEARANEFE